MRPALPDDVQQMYGFVRELAEYERAPEEVTGTAEMLGEALFGPRPVAEALIATLDGETVAMAVFHSSFSTWRCLPGIWLEDLYVSPAHRRSGAGRALVAALARLTIERGGARLEWNALDWNEPALSFYERIGASRLSAWELHQLADDALAALAREAD